MGQYVGVWRKSVHFHHYNKSEDTSVWSTRLVNDLSNCGLTSLDLIFSRLRPKKGFILNCIVKSCLYQLGSVSDCQFKVHIWSGKAADDGGWLGWRNAARSWREKHSHIAVQRFHREIRERTGPEISTQQVEQPANSRGTVQDLNTAADEILFQVWRSGATPAHKKFTVTTKA